MRRSMVGALAAIICLQLLAVAIPAGSPTDARMWDLVRSDTWDLRVRSVERRIQPLPNAGGDVVRPAGHYAIFAVDLTNRSDRPLNPLPGDFVLWSEDGTRSVNLANIPAAQQLAITNWRTPFGEIVAPGATVTTVLLFDIDARASRLTLHYRPANQSIRIDECKCNLPSPVREVGGG